MRGQQRFSVAHVAGRIAVGYALLASLATALAVALREGVPWEYSTPWVRFEPLTAVGISAALGLLLAGLVVLGTRFTVARYSWARQLHMELRPIAHGLKLPQIMLIAGFSSLGEELLFRGLLQPWIGWILASLVFGFAHQASGKSRWIWVGWATVVGFGFGAIFELTGSLVGPLVAHAVVNAVNLTFLRNHDPELHASEGVA